VSRGPGPVRIQSDLVLDADGIDVTIKGYGAVIQVSTSDAGALWTQLRDVQLPARSSRRTATVAAANRLDRLGLLVEVGTHRGGALVELGSVTGPRLTGWLFGTRHLRIRDPRALAALAFADVRRRLHLS